MRWLVCYRPLAELRLDARPEIELLHEYLRSSLPADALIWTAVAAGCEEMTQPRSKCCQDNDIESVNAWLRKDAPDESSRPDVPIDTNLPDPALLPEAPHSPRPQPPFSQLLAGVPDAAQARIKRLQDAATSMQSDVAALSTAKSSEEALRLISGIVKAYDGELYR